LTLGPPSFKIQLDIRYNKKYKMKIKKDASKNFLWVLIAFILISLVFTLVGEFNFEEPEKFSISDVAREVELGNVKSIMVSGDELEIKLTNGDDAVSRKETETGLTETLKNYGVSSESLKTVDVNFKDENGFKYWAAILIPTILPLLIIIGVFFFIFRNAKGGMDQAFTFGKANLKLSSPSKTKTTFDDVADLKEAKEELYEVIDFLKNPKKFLKIGAKIPRGILMVGRPGTGKTLLARAVAGESKVPFFHISASEFVEMFVGVGASRVRSVFETAKKASPSIIFIDEIDAIGRQRGAGMGGGHDEREQTLNQILSEMDGFDKETNVIVMAATNRPDVLDQALLRPGRFDRQVVLDMPDIEGREKILEIHSKKKPLADDVELRKIAVRTPGFSGADLENLLNEAAILTAKNDLKEITHQNIIESIEKVMLGRERRSRVITEKEKKITAYHEAGHALVTAGIKEADPVHKVSIISRGMAGGYTIKLPTEDRRLKTKSEFVAEVAIALGGYVAEQEIFKDITTGSSSDIKSATELVRNLVTQYGMSEKLGPRSFGKTNEMVFLGKEMTAERDYSEEIAEKIDKEVDAFITKGMKLAQKIIKDNKKILDKIADTLIEKETIEHDRFEKIIKDSKLKKISVKSK
jgi:cell division protease FtsH